MKVSLRVLDPLRTRPQAFPLVNEQLWARVLKHLWGATLSLQPLISKQLAYFQVQVWGTGIRPGLLVGRGAVPFAEHSLPACHHAAAFTCTHVHEEQVTTQFGFPRHPEPHFPHWPLLLGSGPLGSGPCSYYWVKPWVDSLPSLGGSCRLLQCLETLSTKHERNPRDSENTQGWVIVNWQRHWEQIVSW